MRRRRYVTEITVLIALGLATGASRASAEPGGSGEYAADLAHAVEGTGIQRVEQLTPGSLDADECQARVLLDCIGVPTVQRLDTIGPAHSADDDAEPEAEAALLSEAEVAAGPQALRRLLDLSIPGPAEPTPLEADAGDEPAAAEAPAIPSTEEQLVALRQAVDAAGFSDQLQVAADSSGDALEIIWPAEAAREP